MGRSRQLDIHGNSSFHGSPLYSLPLQVLQNALLRRREYLNKFQITFLIDAFLQLQYVTAAFMWGFPIIKDLRKRAQDMRIDSIMKGQ